MFIKSLYASVAGNPAPVKQGFDIRSLVPFLLIFLVFYFLLIRPQQKRENERQNMLNAIKNGDEVITSGGLIGKVSKISDTEFTLDICSGVSIRVLKNSVIGLSEAARPKKNNDKKHLMSENGNNAKAPGNTKVADPQTKNADKN